MAGNLVTSDWEFEYRGLLLGGDTDYAYLESNVKTKPPVRSSDQDKLHGHGLWPGGDFLGGRQIILTFDVFNENTGRDGFGALVEEFGRVFDNGTEPDELVFQHPHVASGRKVRTWCTPRRLDVPDNMQSYEGSAICTVELIAQDPRYYSDELFSAKNIGLGSQSSGLTWPLTWPLEWGSVESSSFAAVNNGSRPASPVFTITGPVVNPRIENLTQNKTMSFALTVAEGQSLVVDVAAGTVLLNGVNRYSSQAQGFEWFELGAPGDTIRFGALSGTGLLSAEWRAAWT